MSSFLKRRSKAPWTRLLLAILAALALSALAIGCGLSRPYPAIRSFTLEAAGEPPAKNLPSRAPVLQVTAVGAAAACETRKLVYKIGPNELTEDFYNELTGQPARMIADATARYLEAAGSFRAERTPTIEGPDYALELFVAAFHGDYVASPPKAVLEIRYTLTDMRRQRVLSSQTYQASETLESGPGADRPSEQAAGLGRALGSILAKLDADLSAAVRAGRH